MAKPIVAIVGRPNVGKSALLNRLIGKRESIVESTPGVTRDRIYRDSTWNGRDFTLVDTGGILLRDPDNMRHMIRLQVEAAISEASVIVFVVDIREGLHPLDQDVSEFLRQTQKKIIVAANKADNQKFFPDTADFYSLGMGEPIAVSAAQGIGTGDLLDEIIANLPQKIEEQIEDKSIRISIIGRPNVGKSSILNSILGEERAIVTDIPGTTRDTVDSTFEWGDNKFVFVDTAGMRRKSKVHENVEYYSGQRAKKAIKKSNIGILVLDATDPAVMQDRRISGLLLDNGKGVIVVINKWDLVKDSYMGIDDEHLKKQFETSLRYDLNFLSYAPFIYTSALTGRGIKNILPKVVKVYNESMKKVETSLLNKIFQEAFRFRPPPSYKGQTLKMFYVYQAGVNPPRFIFKVNSPKLLHFSYKRYLEKQLRNVLKYEGTPVQLIFKK